MRYVLLAGAALIAAPAAAQDHSGHAGHQMPAQEEPEDHSAHEQMDHGAMDHSQMDHSEMDHSQMDHGEIDHSSMDHSQMDHSGMDHSAHQMDIPEGPPPPRAFEGPRHAAEMYFDPQRLAEARAYSRIAHGGLTTGMVFVERLEARLAEGHDAYLWDASAWYGTSLDKIVFKTEGEGELADGGEVEDAEMQLLWGHAIGPFIDLQAGMRVDVEPDTTAHFAVGAAGLAPYMIHFDAAAFLSDEGDLTARIEAEHDMRLTQRLILQPRVEAELSAQDIPERGIGSGLSKIEAGARLRYEIVPEFAPYIGVEYEAATGQTADYMRAEGSDPDGVSLLLGLRFWF
ncbi:copper resistance protein B [Aurantiacibacter poecillastricola]|uniref:copper resistance protein B n=1 Tax=Aurantiacibacter poecillastricola TaxID=3064385 RepID=UPI00273E56FC|nr:copper resistance protein B [Aurantiacibacter sp. 219JJ12-13]MDP5261783.1 copper resistance protein B [Aurantiacibacter sp. 219JJ12-13]